MKTKSLLLLSGSAVAGLLVGAGTMKAIRSPDHFGTQYPDLIRVLTSEHLLHAKLLREGRTKEVIRMIESTFASSALYYDMFKLRDTGDVVQLWRIREYAEKHHIEYPAAVALLLANLAPKPASFCDIEEEGKTPNKAPEPTPTSVMPRATSRRSERTNRTEAQNPARVMPAVVVAHL